MAETDRPDEQPVRRLEDVEVHEVSLVDRAANKRRFLIVKRADDADDDEPGEEGVELGKAVWSRAFINDLPDESFLVVEDGGEKDEDGMTVPRSLRHFPVSDEDGELDLPHLRNALARIPQSKLPQKVKDAATKEAQRLLAEATKTEKRMATETETNAGAAGGDEQVTIQKAMETHAALLAECFEGAHALLAKLQAATTVEEAQGVGSALHDCIWKIQQGLPMALAMGVKAAAKAKAPPKDDEDETEKARRAKEREDAEKAKRKADEEEEAKRVSKAVGDATTPLHEQITALTKRLETVEQYRPAGAGGGDPEAVEKKKDQDLWAGVLRG